MLDLIRDPDAFLARATAREAWNDCNLTRAALGLPSSGTQPETSVTIVGQLLCASSWWSKAEEAVMEHCPACPARHDCELRPRRHR
ncbi:hypothetical protein [Elioraea rosea]|uniref:hypothetical protein n=1 Tax=Elioraea rosea TaxID=2492390 RepID=UPI0011836562|nr:hypothetical protein [Elioraea rosea]